MEDIKYKHQFLIDILSVMDKVNEMAIVIQSYIAEFGFLDDESGDKVKELLKEKLDPKQNKQ